MENTEHQPMPTLAERMETTTVAARLSEVRTSIVHLENQLKEAKEALSVTPTDTKQEELLDTIDELGEALEHLREEEQELVAYNTERAPADQNAA